MMVVPMMRAAIVQVVAVTMVHDNGGMCRADVDADGNRGTRGRRSGGPTGPKQIPVRSRFSFAFSLSACASRRRLRHSSAAGEKRHMAERHSERPAAVRRRGRAPGGETAFMLGVAASCRPWPSSVYRPPRGCWPVSCARRPGALRPPHEGRACCCRCCRSAGPSTFDSGVPVPCCESASCNWRFMSLRPPSSESSASALEFRTWMRDSTAEVTCERTARCSFSSRSSAVVRFASSAEHLFHFAEKALVANACHRNLAGNRKQVCVGFLRTE